MKNNLKAIRKIRGVTQVQLSEYLGVSKQVVSMWENNPNENIPTSRLQQIAEFLSVEVMDIISESFDELQLEAQTLSNKVKSIAQQIKDDPYEDGVLAEEQLIQSRVHDLEELDVHKRTLKLQVKEMHDPKPLALVARFSEIVNYYWSHGDPLGNQLSSLLACFGQADNKKFTFLAHIAELLLELRTEDGYEWNEEQSFLEFESMNKQIVTLFQQYGFEQQKRQRHR
jgi:transcriptional regulator with XRE-family HTH domain